MSPRNPFTALTLSAVASALLPLAALALPACLGAESAPDDAAETVAEAPEALVATTSVKITRADGVTVRADGAVILSASTPSVDAKVVVPLGVAAHSGLGGQMAFVESGGSYSTDGGGGTEVFVRSGGTVFLNGGGGAHHVFASTGATVSCTGMGGDVVIHRTAGATLTNCAGATIIVDLAVPSFVRVAASTAANLIYPTEAFSSTLTGSVLTAANHATGSYSNVNWRVWGIDKNTGVTTLFTSTNAAGFTFTVPPGSYSYKYVGLFVTDPVGVEIELSRLF